VLGKTLLESSFQIVEAIRFIDAVAAAHLQKFLAFFRPSQSRDGNDGDVSGLGGLLKALDDVDSAEVGQHNIQQDSVLADKFGQVPRPTDL
jgi:hypothetical protein